PAGSFASKVSHKLFGMATLPLKTGIAPLAAIKTRGSVAVPCRSEVTKGATQRPFRKPTVSCPMVSWLMADCDCANDHGEPDVPFPGALSACTMRAVCDIAPKQNGSLSPPSPKRFRIGGVMKPATRAAFRRDLVKDMIVGV